MNMFVLLNDDMINLDELINEKDNMTHSDFQGCIMAILMDVYRKGKNESEV